MEKIDTSTEAVTKLLDGVTPGPWAVRLAYVEDRVVIDGTGSPVAYDVASVDRRFIAAARDLVPALIADRDALKDEVERLKVQSVTVQDAAMVERVAYAMWKAEADRAAPNVGRNRTPEMFENELDVTRAKWIGLADAALRAIAEGRA